MRDVTGPISIGNGPRSQHSRSSGTGVSTNQPASSESNTEADAQLPPGVVRNISFHGIRATVTKPLPLTGSEFVSTYNPGEIFSCITLNGFDDGVLENITFDDVHITFPGGGTAEQGAVRAVPKVAGEYYSMGVPPACGLFVVVLFRPLCRSFRSPQRHICGRGRLLPLVDLLQGCGCRLSTVLVAITEQVPQGRDGPFGLGTDIT